MQGKTHERVETQASRSQLRSLVLMVKTSHLGALRLSILNRQGTISGTRMIVRPTKNFGSLRRETALLEQIRTILLAEQIPHSTPDRLILRQSHLSLVMTLEHLFVLLTGHG